MHPIITEMIARARQDDRARIYRHPRGELTGRRTRFGRRTADRRY